MLVAPLFVEQMSRWHGLVQVEAVVFGVQHFLREKTRDDTNDVGDVNVGLRLVNSLYSVSMCVITCSAILLESYWIVTIENGLLFLD